MDLLYKLNPNDPVRPIYAPFNSSYPCCQGDALEIPGQTSTLNLPDNLIVADANAASQPNNATAFLEPDGETIYQLQPFARCTEGGPAYGFYNGAYPTQNIFQDGYYGTHFGSGLSAIGGALRYGELTGTGPIWDALQLEVDAAFLYYNRNSDTNPSANGTDVSVDGARWPAITVDSAAPTYYVGTDPNISMGALMAIPPATTAESLGIQTEPGLLLFNALRTYGAYIVDTASAGALNYANFGLQSEAVGEFQEHYGYSFGQNPGGTGPSAAWYSDLNSLIGALAVVNNNGPDSIGGGGHPLAAQAPPFGPTDLTPPSTPANFQASSIATESATLHWSPSTDNVRVMDYQIFNGSQLIGETYGATTLSLNTLQPNTAYTLHVVAVDTGLNVSAPSNTIQLTTLPDTVNSFDEFFQSTETPAGWELGDNTTATFGNGTLTLGHYSSSETAIDAAAQVQDGYAFKFSAYQNASASGNVTRAFFNYQDICNTYAFEFTGGYPGYTDSFSRVVKYVGCSPTVLGFIYGLWPYFSTEIDVDAIGNITVNGVDGSQKTTVFAGIHDTTYTSGLVGFGTTYSQAVISAVSVTPLLVDNITESFQNTPPDWVLNNASIAGGILSLGGFYTQNASAIDNGALVRDGYTFRADVAGQGGSGGNLTRILFNYTDDANTYAFEFTGGPNGYVYSRVVKYVGGNATVLGFISYLWPYTTTQIAVDTLGNITVSGVSGNQVTLVYHGIQDTTFTSGKIGFETNYNVANVANVVVAPL